MVYRWTDKWGWIDRFTLLSGLDPRPTARPGGTSAIRFRIPQKSSALQAGLAVSRCFETGRQPVACLGIRVTRGLHRGAVC